MYLGLPEIGKVLYLVVSAFFSKKGVQSGGWWLKNPKKEGFFIEKWWKVVYNGSTLYLEYV